MRKIDVRLCILGLGATDFLSVIHFIILSQRPTICKPPGVRRTQRRDLENTGQPGVVVTEEVGQLS